MRNNSAKLEVIARKYQEEYQLEGKKILLFIGRFIPEKAVVRFISNIYSLLHKHDDLVLVLVGDGQGKIAVETLLKDKLLKNKVSLPGRFEGDELHAWYVCAHGFALPSLYETFGAVVNEALIFGLKVFCSKYAGAASLIHPGNGVLFDPLNERGIQEKLSHFLGMLEEF